MKAKLLFTFLLITLPIIIISQGVMIPQAYNYISNVDNTDGWMDISTWVEEQHIFVFNGDTSQIVHLGEYNVTFNRIDDPKIERPVVDGKDVGYYTHIGVYKDVGGGDWYLIKINSLGILTIQSIEYRNINIAYTTNL